MSVLNSEYDFENAPCGYLACHPDGTITQINQTLLRWTNYRKEEVIGKKKIDALTNKGTNLYFQMFVYPLLKMQGYVNELSVSIVSSDNSITNCLLNASAIKNEDGSIAQIHAILFAISDRKKYEAEILKAKTTAESIVEHKEQILQAQRRIMSILGHDTRAPLFSINRIIKFAKDGTISPEEIYPYFELMANQLDATLILIDNLLNWANAHLTTKKDKEAPFTLQSVTNDVLELLKGNAVSKNLYLKSCIQEGTTLSTNRSMISFIIRNLVNNAIKYTSEGGVMVSSTVSGGMLNITVSDTGVGMQPERLKKFVKGELSSEPGTDNESGSGMGLMLINEFLLQLKGNLQAESTPGNGTSVTVSVPYSDASQPADTAALYPMHLLGEAS